MRALLLLLHSWEGFVLSSSGMLRAKRTIEARRRMGRGIFFRVFRPLGVDASEGVGGGGSGGVLFSWIGGWKLEGAKR